MTGIEVTLQGRLETSIGVFELVDSAGHRRLPCIGQVMATGQRGYKVYPPSLGNDISSALITMDLREMVRAVVIDGWGVRAIAETGPQAGRMNTVYLLKREVVAYWIRHTKMHWVEDATIRPQNEGYRQ
ncbi:hypothetical protein ACODYM_29265 [Burkholderia gladioli]|uniref:hypothetical protein n=1 Tax=Burkholderia gladioli TaxID=28095 RepID=UPI003B50F8D4